jgi:hypothetical protein
MSQRMILILAFGKIVIKHIFSYVFLNFIIELILLLSLYYMLYSIYLRSMHEEQFGFLYSFIFL